MERIEETEDALFQVFGQAHIAGDFFFEIFAQSIEHGHGFVSQRERLGVDAFGHIGSVVEQAIERFAFFHERGVATVRRRTRRPTRTCQSLANSANHGCNLASFHACPLRLARATVQATTDWLPGTNMPIKLFALKKMLYTPFENPPGVAILREHDIFPTDDPRDADLFISKKWNNSVLLELVFRYASRKQLLVWTDEPRFCVQTKNRIEGPFGIPTVHIMNVFNRGVYFCNYSIYGNKIRGELPDVTRSDVADNRSRKVVALAGYRRRTPRVVIEGVDTDLVAQRQKIALAGHRRGLVDVYGIDWPNGIALGQSRSGDWQRSKQDILKGYRFNLCMENTDFDYYVTEKIWDALNARCLPIYRGGQDKIYEEFERGGFIDTKDFSDPAQIFDLVESMSDAEYCDRLRSCIATYNKIWKRQDYNAEFRRTVEAAVHKIKEIVGATR